MKNNSFLRQIQILFFSLFSGQSLFLGVVSFILYQKETPSDSVLLKVYPITALILLLLGYWLFKKQLDKIVQINDLNEKTATYRAASLMKWACFEAAALLSIVTFFLTSHKNAFYLSLFLLAHFLLHFPTAARLNREMQTSDF